MTRWSEQQLKEYQTRRMLKGTYFLPDQPMDEGEEIENTLQIKIERFLRGKGYPYLSFKKSRAVVRLLPAGWPDLTVVLPQTIIFMELKAKKGRRSKEQKEMALIFYHLGHVIYEVKTWKKFLEIINSKNP